MTHKKSIENRIMSLIFSAGRNFRKENNMCLEDDIKKRLSPVQLETLKFINDRKNPLMKEVSDYLFIAPPSLTPIIDGLEKKKLIRRDHSENDRRVTLLCLTKKGKYVLEETIKHAMEKMHQTFSKLTEKEQETLLGLLEKIAAPKK